MIFIQAIALLIATAIPLLSLYLIYTLDLYRTGAFRNVLYCFFSGVIVFTFAVTINRSMIQIGIVTRENMVRYSAPVVEEILKALILFYLVKRPDFTYFVDGAIYGFSAGIGFAIVENYQYISGATGGALDVAIGRVISTNLIHASASGSIGIVFGLSRFQRSFKRIYVLSAGAIIAIGLHMMFNNLVTRVSSDYIIVYAATVGFTAAILIALTIRRGLAEEKVWIEEKLGAADRVTAGEAAVVKRLNDIQELLAPLANRFGADKASQIEKFLLLQARLGIQRKTLDKLTDDKMRRAVEKQMTDIRVEMDEARRAVGSYAMLYLRHTIPPESSPLWQRLEVLIQERASSRSPGESTSVWQTLSERAAKQNDSEENV